MSVLEVMSGTDRNGAAGARPPSGRRSRRRRLTAELAGSELRWKVVGTIVGLVVLMGLAAHLADSILV